MANYKLIGARFLRMFTADHSTPVYAAETDADNIVDNLCDVEWTRVNVKDATMTSHSTETETRDDVSKPGLDWNVTDRQSFDAAVWCASHSGGSHVAYANAACYVYALPTMSTYPNLTGVTIKATSDPYNASGLRIAVKTSDTLDIPTACSECRTGDFYAAGVAPHKVVTVGTSTNWYPATESKTLAPADTLALKKYLFVFVLKEDFGETRGNWLEGSGFIKNLISIETSGEITGWTDGDTEDCTELTDPEEFVVCKNGVIPDTDGASSSVVYVNCLASGTRPVQDDNHYVTTIGQITDELVPLNSYMGIRTAYAVFQNGGAKIGLASQCHADNKRIGAGFSIRNGTFLLRESDTSTGYSPNGVALTASSLCIPFSTPVGFSASKLRVLMRGYHQEHIGNVGITPWNDYAFTVAGEYLLIVTNDGLTYRSSDGGENWVRVSDTGMSGYHRALYYKGQIIVIAINGSGEVASKCSTDGGASWNDSFTVPVSVDDFGYSEFATDGTNIVMTYSRYTKSKYSLDGGNTWVEGGSIYDVKQTSFEYVVWCIDHFVAFDFYARAFTACSYDNGITWVEGAGIPFIGAVTSTCVDGEAYVLYRGVLAMSSDGSTWYTFGELRDDWFGSVYFNDHVITFDGETGSVYRSFYKHSIPAYFNVWIADGFVDNVSNDDIVNPSLYSADEEAVGPWNLVGQFKDHDETKTFDLPEMSSNVATILVTAYLNQEDVDVDNESSIQGSSSSLYYNGLSTDSDITSSGADTRLVGADTLVIPDITLLG